MTPIILKLERNSRGRDLAIGDIHGHFSRVERELQRIGFDPTRDRLISVGDLVDRGPESMLATEWLGYDWFFAVMGNHDASLLNHWGLLSAQFELWHDYHDWLAALDERAQQELRTALARLPWALEVDTAAGPVGIVHGEVPAQFKSWQEFSAALADERVRALAISGRDLARQAVDLGGPGADSDYRLAGIRWTVHGHTPRRYCRPGQLGNRLWIDTMGWWDGTLQHGEARFTIIDLADPLTPL